jgi:hypothetical protein
LIIGLETSYFVGGALLLTGEEGATTRSALAVAGVDDDFLRWYWRICTTEITEI